MRNSIDAVADRDFALDYLYAAAVLFTHLSRIGEELVLWSSAEFGFARLPETAATGSSMMPQKLNPDVAELTRGKAGTAIGRLTGLLATVKGLPLAYDRDLQEDKAPVFATRRDVRLALQALTVLVSGLEVDRDRLAEAASDPLLLATDAAETLVRRGDAVPRGARARRRTVSRRHVRSVRRRGRQRGRARCAWARVASVTQSRTLASASATTSDAHSSASECLMRNRALRPRKADAFRDLRATGIRASGSRLAPADRCDVRNGGGVRWKTTPTSEDSMKRIAIAAALLLAAVALAGVAWPEGARAVDPAVEPAPSR